jgi:peptidoglycan hydrolase CwlO-like protein
MNSDTTNQILTESTQPLSSLDSHIDDLFSKIAKLNSQLDDEPPLPIRTLSSP